MMIQEPRQLNWKYLYQLIFWIKLSMKTISWLSFYSFMCPKNYLNISVAIKLFRKCTFCELGHGVF